MKATQLVWIRRISQTLFLLFFLFLLVESRLPQDIYLDYSVALTAEQEIELAYPVTFFFELDPLVALTALISGQTLIKGFGWALGVLCVTLFFGRIFCGFICPFGTIHHLIGTIKPALKGHRMVEANIKKPDQRFKYFLLITLLLAALLGLNLSGLLDPISFLFRSLALAVFPGLGIGIKELFDLMAQSDLKALNFFSYGAEIVVSPIFGYGYKSYQSGWLIGGLFLLIILINRIRPRFWCRTLCPLGALLGVFARYSFLRLEKDVEKCTDCKLCLKNCQGAASPIPGEQWETSECLFCFNCFNACPEDAISFEFRWPLVKNKAPDMGRRAVLGGLTAGVALPFLGRLDGQIHKVSDSRLIRPPGSIPENDFLTLCQRCGLCMKACPTNVINPALTEAGMAGFWTPSLIMIQGYCEYTCTLCGSVCPTKAIRRISVKEKIEAPVRIGSAYIVRGRCLPWSGNGPCIVCEEHCPTSPKAIRLYEGWMPGPDGKYIDVKLPYVNLKECVGCGICEYKCPVKGRPAIRIIAAGESRSPRNQILL
ncbi:MAG: 4Fe-4S binding protein [Desulfobacterales bacterium]|uniref:4Fe-4S binding protein n=1 Tax=Candidatus Desulfatibia vada TaxID=2841696 RepID=A0A8J6P263_9BACT|nr:4Fe-4S binding protein [Candidatus Desulfatibia vada]MBL6971314.1 4Fe-4S binding protein [Desulfobacterales bacterium]